MQKQPSSYESVRSDQSNRISVPPELIPSLNKLQTQDYLNFFSKEDIAESRNPVQAFIFKVLRQPGFEYFMATVIVMNMVAMIVETDIQAKEGDDAKAVIHWTGIFGWVVLGIFVLELLMRLFTYRLRFWRDPWNMFDFIIVVVDTSFSIIGLIAGNIFPVSILRIFRLGKLARAFKVFRIFPELRLLLAGLISSMSAIFWGTVLLIFFLLVWALVAVLCIHPLNKDIDYGDACERCPRAYSSVMQATLTFWAQIVTGDSWGQASIPLIEKHPGTAIFFILLYLSVGMAVTNLILGVVVNVAQRSQDALQEEDSAEKALFKLEKHTHLLKICRDMDMDNDGILSADEVYAAMQTPGDFRESVLALDISEAEFDIVWRIIDTEQKGYVSYKELVRKLSTMKASDTQFMLAYIKYYMTMLRNAIVDKIDDQEHKADAISRMELQVMERNVDAELSKMENMERNLEAELCNVEHRIEHDLSESQEGARECGAKSGKACGEPTTLSASKLRHLNHEQDASCGARSAKAGKIPQSLLEQVRQDIASLQVEMKGMFMDMNSKLGSQVYQMSPSAGEILSSNLRSDLLVLPAKQPNSSSLPMCCRSLMAPERFVTQIPVLQAQNSPVSANLAPTPLMSLRSA